MERYFEVTGVPEDQWLYVAKIAMEGKALPWFRWWEENATSQSWASFKKAVIKRFQLEFVQNPFETLLSIKQEGLVRDFRKKFEMYSSLLKVTERRYLLGLFLNGLKDEVRAELKLQSYHTLDELMDLAKLVESPNHLLSRCGSK